ncbi:synaptotagmin-like protein 2 isoform X4 [Alosa alosa]|uniref:synaptotagmin-like protein 2 isoform X4 n=1 Tax=Alosa alosa TaxID=278164 RepID=UPI002015109B|nr:synaptotagmin-like protein 2 isoform X4 [Alosa alosa]
MIDLSFLTDEEQEMIMVVLKRDAELKKSEDQRVKDLQKTMRDRNKLKYMTGEWFYETKSQRHRDRIHGSDIIRASIRQRKPVTVFELSKVWAEKPSFVNSGNRDVFLPPELAGIIDEPQTQSKNQSREYACSSESQSGVSKPAVQPQVKLRLNPFNNRPTSLASPGGESQQVSNGTTQTVKTPARGWHDGLAQPPASEVSSLHATVPETDNSEDTSPVRTMLKRASRPMSLSKSLEDITTMPARKCPVKMGEERMRTDQRSDLMLSANDVSVAPSSPTSAPDPEQMKRISASVPAFLQQESYDRESDCTSENSFYSPHRPQKRNSHTNHSFSSGMASMSSSVSGSIMSIYSGDFGSVDVKGTIQFAMNYVEKLGEFHIFVVQCRDLAVAEPKRNRSDPYVKCYLLPDKTKLGKRKTSIKKKTLNPTFNEILRYKISFDTLRITTLNLSVWHNDNFGRNSFLGEVDVDLREWSISDTQMKDYLLRPRVVSRPNTTEQRGDMRVALRFLPQVTQSKRASKAGEVQIWVRECKNLPVVRGVIIDPFVKCTVLPDTSRKGRQKTRVAKKTADPVFNHTMVYDGFKLEDLREACVELTVWDHDRLSNHFLGGLRLGLGTGKSYGSEVTWMDSTSDEAKLWNRMMISQGEWVEDVLPLRMLMMAK